MMQEKKTYQMLGIEIIMLNGQDVVRTSVQDEGSGGTQGDFYPAN